MSWLNRTRLRHLFREKRVPLKGYPLQVFTDQTNAGISDLFVDLADYNAVLVDCYVRGSSPTIRLSIEGNAAPGGNYLPVPDPNGRRAWIRQSMSFMVVVGSRFAKARINSISGTGAAITVILSPFVHPGGFPGMPISLLTSAADAALANVATMDVWTPSTGTAFNLLGGVITTSVAGDYALQDSSNTITVFRLAAGTPFPFDFRPNGARSASNGNVLGLRNSTGSTANVRCTVWGMEEP